MISIPVSDVKKTARNTERRLFGFVLVSEKTAAFLNYTTPQANTTQAKVTKRTGSTSRTTSKIDGSDSKTAPVADSLVLGGDKDGRKGKRVVFKTNKPTKPSGKNKKEISINVPVWMTSLDISDLIATAFTNIKYGYGENEIQPYFKVGNNGVKYPIITKAAASQLTSGAGVDVGAEATQQPNASGFYIDAVTKTGN